MRVKCVVAVLVILAAACSAAFAAKSKPKPAAVPIGQAQLGRDYVLGKSSPIGVTIKSAEFTVKQVAIGERAYCPTADQKILLLHFRVQNPQKAALPFAWHLIDLNAVDSKGAVWEPAQDVASEETRKSAKVSLKPKQALDVYTVFMIPAGEQITGLIVKANDGPAFGCDLKGKIKPLPAPFADTEDTTGSTALADVPAAMGVYYPINCFDLKLDSAAYTDQPIAGSQVGEGSRTLVLTLTARNGSTSGQGLESSSFEPRLVESDGATLEWNQVMLNSDKDEPLSAQLPPGAEVVFRYYWVISQDTELKTLTIKDSDSRRYVFDMSGVK